MVRFDGASVLPKRGRVPYDPVEPAWKGFDACRDVVPPRAGLQGG